MTDSALKPQIQSDMKDAMRAKETVRLVAIRMLLAAIKQKEIDERVTLSDTDIFGVINKMIKQRRESAKQYHDANRPELAAKEEEELEYLYTYLPKQLDQTEITAIIEAAVAETGATNIKDMGAVMNQVRPKVQGRADMSAISTLIKQKLS